MDMQIPQALPEHQWLQRLIGDWTFETECSTGPDEPPMKSSGKQSVTALGDLWVLMEMTGPTPGGTEARSIIQLGYDPQKQKFVGTFIFSLANMLWSYVGTLDSSGKVLTLNSEGPSFSDPDQQAHYQDIFEIIDDNQFIFRSQVLGPDGQWVPFMKGLHARQSTPSVTDSADDAMHTLTPHLICADAIAAMDFYQRAFNAVEEVRLMGPTGKLMHGAMRIGKDRVMLAEENPDWGSLSPKILKGTPTVIHLIVPNVDAAIAQAIAAGATLKMPASDMFWGDRYGQVIDPFGHHWSLATPVRRLNPDQMQAAMQQAFASHGK